jgi:hypothetical protein
MYIAIVVSTMLVLLAAFIFFDRVLHPTESMIFLVGHWFVFWGVGIRLGLAGLRQFLQPSFTARDIFGDDQRRSATPGARTWRGEFRDGRRRPAFDRDPEFHLADRDLGHDILWRSWCEAHSGAKPIIK